MGFLRNRWLAAALVAAAIFMGVFVATVLVTVSLERSYLGVARVEVVKGKTGAESSQAVFDPYFLQTELEKIRSMAVAQRAVDSLGLQERWARRFGVQSMSRSEAAAYLVKALDVRQSRNTSLLEIRFYGDNPEEAAEVANGVAAAYRAVSPRPVRIIDPATPSLKPIRPNVPLNLLVGALAGLVLGGVAGGLILLATWKRATSAGGLTDAAHAPSAPGMWRPWMTWALVLLTGLFLWSAIHFLRRPLLFRMLSARPAVSGGSAVMNGTLSEPEIAQRIAGTEVVRASNGLGEKGLFETDQAQLGHFLAGLESQKARLQFRLVAGPNDTNSPADEFADPRLPTGIAKVRVLKEVLLDGSAVVRAALDWDDLNDRPQIRVRLNEAGARRFERVTGENINRQLAIIWGDRLLMAPILRTRISGGEVNIQGNFTLEEAHSIIDALNNEPAPASKQIFGPVVERVVPRQSVANAFVLLDLDTGLTATNQSSQLDSREWHRWVREHGLDVRTAAEKRFATLFCLEMVVVPAKGRSWETCTPADVLNNWSLLTAEPVAQVPITKTSAQEQPEVYLFRTREDGWGVLQILGDSADDPPGVKIRYRLVPNSHARGERPNVPGSRAVGPASENSTAFPAGAAP